MALWNVSRLICLVRAKRAKTNHHHRRQFCLQPAFDFCSSLQILDLPAPRLWELNPDTYMYVVR